MLSKYVFPLSSCSSTFLPSFLFFLPSIHLSLLCLLELFFFFSFLCKFNEVQLLLWEAISNWNMLVPGVDLIEPLLRMQADRIQDAFFSPQWKLLNHWFQNQHKICSDLPQTACVMLSSVLGEWGKHIFKKGMFPSVHSERYLNSAQAKNILKS